MRGKGIQQSYCRVAVRITPAHAGKSSHPYYTTLPRGDHPRTCGEKCPSLRERRHWHRITPAHAGKRPELEGAPPLAQDHPRTCGEKGLPSLEIRRAEGSPPHMRGKVRLGDICSCCPGITPAHAGKRRRSLSMWSVCRDHPRTCGEKSPCHADHQRRQGSPPHMRGKECRQYMGHLGPGITPAHAGKRLKRSRSTVPHAAIVPLFPSVCNKPAGSDGSLAGHDAPPFLPIENAAPASPAYNLRSL